MEIVTKYGIFKNIVIWLGKQKSTNKLPDREEKEHLRTSACQLSEET